MDEEELLKKLREAFKTEAQERLASMSANLLELEKTADADKQAPVLEIVFREAHSLKGAARAVNLTDIEALCQSVEGIFAKLQKNAPPSLSPDLFDILHDSIRAVENTLFSADEEQSLRNKENISCLITKLEESEAALYKPDNDAENVSEPVTKPEASETIPYKPDISGGPDNDPENVSEPVMKPEASETIPYKPDISGGPDNDAENISEPVTKPEASETIPYGQEEPGNDARFQNQTLNANTADDSDGVRNYRSQSPFSGTVRISAAKLDTLFLKVEELTSLKLMSAQHLLDIRSILSLFEQWKKKWVQIETEYRTLRRYLKADPPAGSSEITHGSLPGLMTFADWNYDHMQSLAKEMKSLKKAAENEQRILSRMTDALLDDMKKVMMLPFSSLSDIFPRMMRDILRDKGKEAELLITGGEIEIDRRILEEIKDPLTHLLRNAIDHGVEYPRARVKQGKHRSGIIKLTISQTESSKVDILVSDDGKGVNLGRIKEEAVDSGIISEKEAENIRNEDVLWLIFRSGISSSKMVTEISGRGLGLAIVQEKVEKLGGFLSADSFPGKGTSFRIRIPVTLTTFRGILVRVAASLFIIPGAYAERVLKIRREKIKTIENRASIAVNGEVVSLVELADILGLSDPVSEPAEDTEFVTVIIMGIGQRRMAFRVAEILCEQEILAKGLGTQLARVPHIAGATILGTGKVVPILNVHDLLKFSSENKFSPWTSKKTFSGDEAAKKKNILVAEDSITSRMLIKNILESAGYAVRTAADGQAAHTLLRTEEFDVVVSDVEMPRLNGFELTEKIRANEKLSGIPVVLVTSLDSDEDRERGIDAGANAYIVKGSFDQSNLLEVIDRLI